MASAVMPAGTAAAGFVSLQLRSRIKSLRSIAAERPSYATNCAVAR
jgi:hypothetical protein